MIKVLDDLRAIGLPMVSRYSAHEVTPRDENGVEGEPYMAQRFVCWTTDEAKKNAAESLGVAAYPYVSRDPRFSGWEIVATVVLP